MKLLLDTHILLWAAAAHANLGSAAAMIEDPANDLVFSAASLWEIITKHKLGRADFQANPHLLRRGLLENGYTPLAISVEHTLAVGMLPDHHRDPFDRILIAQAIVEGITLITADPLVALYPGPILKV